MNKTKKQMEDSYREEVAKQTLPDAKAIMNRNEPVFISVMQDTLKIINKIKDSKDYEFQLVLCNTLTDQFRNFGFNLAINKLTELQSKVPKGLQGTAKAEYVDRAIG